MNNPAPLVITVSQTLRVTLAHKTSVQIPPSDNHPAISLSFVDLHLLYNLARATGATLEWIIAQVRSTFGEAASAHLEELTTRLLDRGLLVPASLTQQRRNTQPQLEPTGNLSQPVTQSDALVTHLPLMLDLCSEGYIAVNHDGAIQACLAPEELMVLAVFCSPQPLEEAFSHYQKVCLSQGLSQQAWQTMVSNLIGAALLQPHGSNSHVEERATVQARASLKRMNEITAAIDHSIAQHEERNLNAAARTVRVIPVSRQRALPPLALGMLIAAARAFENGALLKYYDFIPNWESRPRRLDRYAKDDGIYLFSNYIWSHKDNLELSAQIKAANPRSVTIHGGPDSPKQRSDLRDYFRNHPHVDIVVHGEGEITFCHLLAALVDGFEHHGELPDLDCLKDVPGLSYRKGDAVISSPDRTRIADIDLLPSPYLTGLFDAYETASSSIAILETNRGCPYACTFCDWGSATQSKVRKFALERVFAELEWCAKNKVGHIFLADANFGMLERDVLIAEKVAELKNRYGYPKAFSTNYAKNQVRYLRRIVEVLVESGVVTEGLLSLQSMDEPTLAAIKRSNIKTEKYDELANEFRKAGLPLFVDLMIGLPGATLESFKNDLQQCIDREVTVKIFQTEVLVNSPMNDPDYREKHRIETVTASSGLFSSRVDESAVDVGLGRAVIVASSSFTRSDYAEMLDLRKAFRLFENYGVLRQVSRYVRQVTGTREIDFIDQLRLKVRAAPERWPYLFSTLTTVPEIMAPPVSWRRFVDEVGDLLTTHWSINDDSALRCVLEVQLALLPARGRNFPLELRLPHDFAAWHEQMMSAKENGGRTNWHQDVPALKTFAPARFRVEDPNRVCEIGLGYGNDDDFYGDWELQSPVSRAMLAKHLKLTESA